MLTVRPNVRYDVMNVLLRLREGCKALVTDIKELFLQVKVPKSDRGAL